MKTALACLFLTVTINSYAFVQPAAVLNKTKLIKEARKEASVINELLAIGADVSPFYSPQEVKEFIADYEKISHEGDVWEIIDSCNNGAAFLLQQFIQNEKYVSIKIDTMVNTYKTYSPDGNIIIHNWYTNNGGTFMMYKNIAEVKLANGKRSSYEMDYLGSIYETGFVPNENFTGYYFIGSTKGCSTCYDYSVMLFSLTESGLEPMNILESVNEEIDYAFAIYFRGWDFDNNYISYNEIDHAFEYGHKNDDAAEDDIFYEEGRWTFDGKLFRQEVSMQIDRVEFDNLFGEADNN